MTKEELQRISINNRKLEKLKEKYETLRNKSQAKGQIISDMPHGSGMTDTIGDYTVELVMVQSDIELMELETDILVRRARRFMGNVSDWVICEIIESKYINNLYVDEIIYMLNHPNIKKESDINRILNVFFLESLLYM